MDRSETLSTRVACIPKGQKPMTTYSEAPDTSHSEKTTEKTQTKTEDKAYTCCLKTQCASVAGSPNGQGPNTKSNEALLNAQETNA